MSQGLVNQSLDHLDNSSCSNMVVCQLLGHTEPTWPYWITYLALQYLLGHAELDLVNHTRHRGGALVQ